MNTALCDGLVVKQKLRSLQNVVYPWEWHGAGSQKLTRM